MIKLSDNKDTHDKSCVMMLIEDNELIKKLDKFNKANIPEKDVDVEEGGRETEYHITVLYGLDTVRVSDILDYIEDDIQHPITVTLGKITRFEQDGYDVIKIDIKNADKLQKMWKKLRTNLENDNKYSNYEPHCTLAYITKGSCPFIDDDDTFDGIEVELNTLKFSPSGDLKPAYLSLADDQDIDEMLEQVMDD